MEPEKKSLDLGGSEQEYWTLRSLLDTDQTAASTLFDQILRAAAKSDSNPRLLGMLVQRAFDVEEEEGSVRSFFNPERQQRWPKATERELNRC